MDYLFVGPHLEHTSEGRPVYPYEVVSLDDLKAESEALTNYLISQAPAREAKTTEAKS